MGLLPVVRDLRNGAGGCEGDHGNNKTRKDDSFCDILSSKPIHTDDGGLHGCNVIFSSISSFLFLHKNRSVIPIRHLLDHRNGCFTIQVSLHGLFPREE